MNGGARRELRLRRGQGGVCRIPVRAAPAAGRVRRPLVTIEPGFVRTRMTAGMGLPPLPAAEPDEVAGQVRLRALAAARVVR